MLVHITMFLAFTSNVLEIISLGGIGICLVQSAKESILEILSSNMVEK